MTDDEELCGAPTTKGGECQNTAKSCPWHSDDEEPPDTGRPSKLSYERQEQIAEAIEQGRSLNSASRMAGITPNTVYNWLDRGEAEVKAGNDNEYTEFFRRVTRAKGHGEEYYFGLALELARENEDHRFIASLMKQRYPDSWGDTDTGVDAEKTVINLPDSITEKWRRNPQNQ